VAVNIVGPNQNHWLASAGLSVLMVARPLLIGLLPLTGFFDTAVELQSKLFYIPAVVLIFVSILLWHCLCVILKVA